MGDASVVLIALLAACGGGSVAPSIDAPPPDAAVLPVAAIPLTTPNALFYVAQVAAGDQTFAMIIDTGSTTTAVAGTSCASCEGAGISPLYMPSPTAIDAGATAMTFYADGSSWEGEIFQDTVGVGSGVPNVELELTSITMQTGFFRPTEINDYQGILALGLDPIPDPGTDPYVHLAVLAGVTPALAFELCDTTGTMWLGGYGAASATAAPQYTPMLPLTAASDPFYSVNVDDLSIGGTSLGFAEGDFHQPIVDTGTSYFYLPTPVFAAMLSAINTSSGYTSLFQTPLTEQPDGCVTAAGVTSAMVDAALPAMTISLPAADGSADFAIGAAPTRSYLSDMGGGKFCLVAGDGGTGAVLGDSFMRGFVTVIDLATSRIGFAPDAGCPASVSGRAIDRTRGAPRLPRYRR